MLIEYIEIIFYLMPLECVIEKEFIQLYRFPPSPPRSSLNYSINKMLMYHHDFSYTAIKSS